MLIQQRHHLHIGLSLNGRASFKRINKDESELRIGSVGARDNYIILKYIFKKIRRNETQKKTLSALHTLLYFFIFFPSYEIAHLLNSNAS